MPFTIRGMTRVTWTPEFTLTLSSTDGNSLRADGALHPLVATLFRTSNLSRVPNRRLRLGTTPSGRVGDQSVKVTDSGGRATFGVSDLSAESVVYSASLLPQNAVTSNDVTILWTMDSVCVVDIVSNPTPDLVSQSETPWYIQWEVTWTQTTTTTGIPPVMVTLHEGECIYNAAELPAPAVDEGVVLIESDGTNLVTNKDAIIADYTTQAAVLVAELESGGCQ